MRATRIDTLPLELQRKWAAGRVWAAHRAPYLANALLALEPAVVTARPDDDDADDADDYEDLPADLCRFPADRTWHVHIDAQVLARTEVDEIGFWLIHQASHLLREHAARYPGTDVYDPGSDSDSYLGRHPDQQRWNVAADAEINDDLDGLLDDEDEEHDLPEQAVTPQALALPHGRTAEQYWTALNEDPSRASEAMLEGDCGSGSDGQPRLWNCGWAGLSDLGAQMVAQDTARRIRDHNRTRDDIPAGWRRWSDNVLEPTVNWRRQLGALLRRGVAEAAGRVDFTYRRPSRRSPALPGVVLPSLRQPLPAVTMIIDTSGSMDDAMLGQALGEVSGVMRALGIGRRLKVICCDAQAYNVQSVRNIGDVQLAGGGGSDIRTGFSLALRQRPRPDLIVALTDGHTPWPEGPPPRSRVVVGLLDPRGQVPDWAESVPVGNFQAKGKQQ
jgi:hypothetical protein